MALLTIQSTPLSTISVITTNLTTNFDRGTVGENSTSTAPLGNVLSNDISTATLVDYRVISYSSVSTSNKANAGESLKGKYGTLVIKSDGSYSYVPDNSIPDVAKLLPGVSLTEEFIYVSGSSGQNAVTGNSRLFITINGENDAPVAVADRVEVDEGQTFVGSVATNDTDVDHAASGLTYSLKKTNGVEPNVPGLKFNTDGSFTFDANNPEYDKLAKGEVREIQLGYTVSDGSAQTESMLTIVVKGTNDAPVAQASTTQAIEGESARGQLLATDVDKGDKLTYSLADGQTPVADLTLNSDGAFTFDASGVEFDNLAKGEKRFVKFNFQVSDQNGASSTATQTIEVTGTNDAPVAEAGTTLAIEGESAKGQLLATDVDKGDKLTYSLADGQAKVAGLTLNSDGSFTFDANDAEYDSLAKGEKRSVKFNFQVSDQNGASSTATQTIEVTGTNDAPVAEAGTTLAIEGESAKSQLVATDVDKGDKLTYSLADGQTPVVGLTLNSDGSFTFDANDAEYDTLAKGQKRLVKFNFQVSDQNGASSTATQTIEVTGTNDAPVAIAGTTSTTEGVNATGKLKATDVDQGDRLTYNIGRFIPAGTTLLLNTQDGSFNLAINSPEFDSIAKGETRSVTFEFLVKDQHGASSYGIQTIEIAGTNDDPVARAGTTLAKEGQVTAGRLIGTDVDNNDQLTFALANPLTQIAGLMLKSDGTFTFDGNDPEYDSLAAGKTRTLKFDFKVSDQHGASSTATQTIEITGTNDAPVAKASATLAKEGLIANGQLLASDVDDQDTLTYSIVGGENSITGLTLGLNGQFTIDANHPFYNALGEAQELPIEFEFEVTDLAGASSRAKHTIQLTGSNDAPVATGKTTQVTEGQVISDQLLATDPDGADRLLYSLADGQAPIAGLQIFEDGAFTFDAKNRAYSYLANGEKDIVTFNYTVKDLFGGVSTATQTIEITGSNSDPVALTGLTFAKEGKSVNGQVFATDADEGDVLTYSLADGQAPVAGLTLNPDGRFNFDADNPAYNALAEGERRSVKFNFKVTDQAGGSSVATHTIDLVGTNDAPLLGADVINAIEGNGLYKGSLRTNDSDPDNNAVLTYSNPNNVAGFTLNADGSYEFNSDDAAYDLLSNGRFTGSINSSTTIFSVTVFDGFTGQFSEVRINVAGVNDAAVIGTPNNATVTEDVSVTNGMLTATGTISIIDPDRGEASFSTSVQSQIGNLGTLSLSADGSYTYSVSNTLAGVQALNSNQTKIDGFTIRSVDGTSKVVNFTIVGKNELASTRAVVTNEADPNDNDGAVVNTNGGGGNDVLYGGSGNSNVDGRNGNDLIYGGSGNDDLSGSNGLDTLYGGSGNDTIRGGNDNDLIYGGYGADSLTGQGGSDTFAYLSVKDTGDTIADFTSTDIINFTQLKNASGVLVKLNAYNPASTTLQAMSIYSVVVGGNTVVQVDTDGNVDTAELEITLTGAITLASSNFVV